MSRSLPYNKVQANRILGACVCWQEFLSVADVCEISKSKAEGWRSCVPEEYRSEIPYSQELDCSANFIFHFIYLSLGFGIG